MIIRYSLQPLHKVLEKNGINGKPRMSLTWPTQLTKNLTESGAGWDASPLQGYRLHFVAINPLYT